MDWSEYEIIIAYHAMTNTEYLNAIADYVKPEFFENVNIAKYFEIVRDFYDKRQKLPTISEVKPYLTNDILKSGFTKLINEFKTLTTPFDKKELYENTEKFLKERASWCAILDVSENLDKKVKNPMEVLESFESICKICLDIENGIELYADSDKIVEDILNDDKSISTQWPWLDNMLEGGWREDGKALYILAGQANIGKSIFLGNIAANIANQGKTVLVVSLEMSELLYAKRIASNVTKIPMRNFREDVHTLKYALSEEQKKTNGRIFIKEFPPSTITPKQLSSFIKKMIDSGIKLDAVVIDYLGLLHSPVGKDSYERGKYVSEQVRAMTYLYTLPIITALQLNRSVVGRENPGMEGLAESFAYAATADMILSIFQSEEDMELGIIKLGMMKNRFGPRGTVQAMLIDYNTLSLRQSDEDEECFMDGLEDSMSILNRLSN